jgi:hypothetical protein
MSCADVCLDHGCYDGAEFSTTKVVRARKPHRCGECRDEIPVGADYERCAGKWDGVIDTMRTCLACAEIRAAFVCGSWVFEMLWESIEEEMFPVWWRSGNWDCLAKLTSEAAIAKCNARYKAWLGDMEDME